MTIFLFSLEILNVFYISNFYYVPIIRFFSALLLVVPIQ